MEKNGQQAFLDSIHQFRTGEIGVGRTPIDLTLVSGPSGEDIGIGIANGMTRSDVIYMEKIGFPPNGLSPTAQ